MNTSTQLSVTPRVYRPSLESRIAPFLFSLAFVAFLWLISLEQSSSILLTILIILSFGFPILGALLCLLGANTRIETMPEGITYYGSGFCLYSPWENIVAVEKVVMGVRSIDSLRLYEEAVDRVSLEEGMKGHFAVMTKVPTLQAMENALPYLKLLVKILHVIVHLKGGHHRSRRLRSSRLADRDSRRYIPVGLFGDQWKYGELLQDIQQYAFQALTRQEPPRPHHARKTIQQPKRDEDNRHLYELLIEQEAKEQQQKAVSPPTQPPPP